MSARRCFVLLSYYPLLQSYGSQGHATRVLKNTSSFCAAYPTFLVDAAYFKAYHDLPIRRDTLVSELNLRPTIAKAPNQHARTPKGIYLTSPDLNILFLLAYCKFRRLRRPSLLLKPSVVKFRTFII
jgi:hypothetical protein